MNARRLIAFIALATLTACSQNGANTQVMVTVDAEAGVQAAARVVLVHVYGGPSGASQGELPLVQEYPIAVPPHNGWPIVIALAPIDRDPTRIYRVEALAYDVPEPTATDVPVATVRAFSGYVPGQTVLLRLLLQDACLGQECTDITTTCDQGECVTARVPVEDLLPFGDAGPRPDAYRPDRVDGGDASVDGGPPCTATSCDDGHACTVDFCAVDGCGHMAVDVICADSNPCTDDRCDDATASDGCSHRPNTVACDDGIFCNGLDSCGASSCSVHTGDVCVAPLTCNETLEQCMGCSASDPCPDAIYGSYSACAFGASECAESGTQTRTVLTFTCNASGACESADGTDTTACTRVTAGRTCMASSCDAMGPCSFGSTCAVGGTAFQTCHDFQCASGACADMPRNGTVSCSRPSTDGDTCDDGIGCTSGDVCGGGICAGTGTCDAGASDAGFCDDHFTCTNDTLASACTFTPDDTRCDDGNGCSVERCDPSDFGHEPGSGCVRDYSGCTPDAGPPPDAGGAPCLFDAGLCDDGDGCTDDTCSPTDPLADPGTGCRHTPSGTCVIPTDGGAGPFDAGGPFDGGPPRDSSVRDAGGSPG